MESTTEMSLFNSTMEFTTQAAYNASNMTGEYPHGLESIIVPVAWGIILIIGMLGNGVVIYTLLRNGDRTATSYYILNLAISDMSFLTIVVPFTSTMFAMPDWIFGRVLCKLTFFMINASVHATCLTLTAMTIDRYLAIVHPVTTMGKRTGRVAMIVSVCIWIATIIACTPFAIYHDVRDGRYFGPRVYCMPTWPSQTWKKSVTVVVSLTTYVIPLTIILFCYTLILKNMWLERAGSRQPNGGARPSLVRRRRKVAKMVAVVVLMFALCWLPIHVFLLCEAFITNFPKTPSVYDIKIIANSLSYANSCVNPFIYAFFGDGFRKAFKRSFPCFSPKNGIEPSTLETLLSRKGLFGETSLSQKNNSHT